MSREGYDWDTIQQSYDAVKLMSGSSVASQYDNVINNKQFSPLFLLKQDKRVNVRILSVSFVDKLAQVRFIKHVQNMDGSPATDYQPSNWIATIAYDYDKTIQYEKDRLINPLGFEVTSYRVDQENVPGEGGK
jgi:type IV secretion system protein VirB8